MSQMQQASECDAYNQKALYAKLGIPSLRREPQKFNKLYYLTAVLKISRLQSFA